MPNLFTIVCRKKEKHKEAIHVAGNFSLATLSRNERKKNNPSRVMRATFSCVMCKKVFYFHICANTHAAFRRSLGGESRACEKRKTVDFHSPCTHALRATRWLANWKLYANREKPVLGYRVRASTRSRARTESSEFGRRGASPTRVVRHVCRKDDGPATNSRNFLSNSGRARFALFQTTRVFYRRGFSRARLPSRRTRNSSCGQEYVLRP